MTDIAYPTNIPNCKEFQWGLSNNTQVFTNPLTGSLRTRGIPGYRWVCSMTWGELDQATSARVEAFLAQLRGQENRLLMYNIMRPTPQGTALGTPLVNGGGQTGNTLVTDGWTPSQANLLLPGDFFGVAGMLLMVTALAAANGSGQSTITFEPPMWAIPGDNVAITITKPVGRFISTSPIIKWRSGADVRTSDHTLELVEALSTS